MVQLYFNVLQFLILFSICSHIRTGSQKMLVKKNREESDQTASKEAV